MRRWRGSVLLLTVFLALGGCETRTITEEGEDVVIECGWAWPEKLSCGKLAEEHCAKGGRKVHLVGMLHPSPLVKYRCVD